MFIVMPHLIAPLSSTHRLRSWSAPRQTLECYDKTAVEKYPRM